MPESHLSARSIVGVIVVMSLVLALLSAALAAARGNTDAPPSLTTIGTPPVSGAAPPSPPDVADPKIETARISAHLPDGWTVESHSDEELVLAGPHVVVHVSDRAAADPKTDAGLADDALAADQKRYPDAKLCHQPIPAAVNNGPNGTAFALCFTAVPQNGRAVAANALIVEALFTSKDGIRHRLTERAVFADDDADAAAAELPAVTSALRWKSYSG